MIRGLRLSTVVVVILVAALAQAAAPTISKNPSPPTTSSGPSLYVPGPATITQSTSTTITTGNSVSCNAGGLHTDNSYYRFFTLSLYNPPLDSTQFAVQSVTFGIEEANDFAGAGQPVSVIIYKPTTNPATMATLGAALQTVALTVPDQALTLYTANLTPAYPVFTNATDILGVEVFTPNGQTASNSFYIGSNALGQSAPSYIRAADCGVTEPTATGSIGFPGMHIVMSVSGNNQLPVELQTLSIE